MQAILSRLVAVERRTHDPRSLRLAAISALIAVTVIVAVASLSSQHPSLSPAQRSAKTWARVPAAAREAISRGIGQGEHQFYVTRGTAGLVARNAGFAATFERDGVAVGVHSSTALRLGLVAIGRGRSLTAVVPTAPVSKLNAVTYRHAGVDEWYANGPSGLEQGFTLYRRIHGNGKLTLYVGRLSPGTRAVVAAGGSSLVLTPAVGRRLRYSNLTVTDDLGRRLPARVEVAHGSVTIQLDDTGARYPITIDPTVELNGGADLTEREPQRRKASDIQLAISGDDSTLVVGAPHDTPSRYSAVYGGAGIGTAYVFTKPATGGWQDATATAQLAGSDTTGNDPVDNFGSSVAISKDGHTIAVGDPRHASQAGAVYVFTEPASGGWKDSTETAELTASDGVAAARDGSSPGDDLGKSVAVDDDGSSVIAGAPNHSSEGAVYVWSEPTAAGGRARHRRPNSRRVWGSGHFGRNLGDRKLCRHQR